MKQRQFSYRLALVAFILAAPALIVAPWSGGSIGLSGCYAADWRQWRRDANRSASSPDELPERLHLQWKREQLRPRPAFPFDVRLCFDLSYEPVVMGKTIFVPSMVTDSLTAFDTDTGSVKWRFFSEGPVRFAPVAGSGNVYFVSDDGYLYCVRALDGVLLWRVRGAPPRWKERRLLGNGRMISRWPALGGPVIADGKVFFAAGFWTNEGVYVCAVDAETGRLVWRNEECSFVDSGQNDHGGRWYGGLCPQGYLAVIGGKLAVPNGRALPAFFDLRTGEMAPYTSGWGGRFGLAKGSWWTCGVGSYFFHTGDMFGVTGDAARINEPPPKDLLTPSEFAELADIPLATVERWLKEKKLKTVKQGNQILIQPGKPQNATYLAWWTSNLTAGERLALESRPRLQISPMNRKEAGVFREPVLTNDAIFYSKPKAHVRRPSDASYSEIVGYDITNPKWGLGVTEFYGATPLIAWKTLRFPKLWSVESGLKVHIKAGGRLYCGGKGTVAALDIPKRGQKPRFSWQAELDDAPATMLAADGKLFVVTRPGTIYCFGSRQVSPKVHALKFSAAKPEDERWSQMADEIVRRAVLKNGYCLVIGFGTGGLVRALVDVSEMQLIVVEPDPKKVEAARSEFHSRGLYGRRLHVLRGTLESLELPPYFASVVAAENEGPLRALPAETRARKVYRCLRPYGGVACLPISEETHAAFVESVKRAGLPGNEIKREARLTVLTRAGALPGAGDWTRREGGPGNTYASNDRAAEPPFGLLWFGGSMHRIFRYQGFSAIALARGEMAVSVSGKLYAVDAYTGRQMWKKSMNANDVIASGDSVYILTGGVVRRLDPLTGAELGAIPAPQEVAPSGKERWRGACRVWKKYLVGVTTGGFLVCVDRRDGRMFWKRKCEKDGLDFALGGGKAFCVDYWRPLHERRADGKEGRPSVFALDMETGRVVWQRSVELPSDAADAATKKRFQPLRPQLAYSEESDTLVLTAVRATIGAYRGTDGAPLWRKNIPCKDFPSAYTASRPPIVLPGLLITHAGAMYELRTGKLLSTRLWRGANRGSGGTRGCGRALANRRIVTVRDAHASFFDLSTGCQTFIRGVRAGCAYNLIPAGGLLLAPYNAWQCTCNWGVRTSFALAKMPEAAEWTRAAFPGGDKRLMLVLHPGEKTEFPVVLQNWSESKMDAKLEIEAPEGWSISVEESKIVLAGRGARRQTVKVALPAKETGGLKAIRIKAASVLSLEPSLVEVYVTKRAQ